MTDQPETPAAEPLRTRRIRPVDGAERSAVVQRELTERVESVRPIQPASAGVGAGDSAPSPALFSTRPQQDVIEETGCVCKLGLYLVELVRKRRHPERVADLGKATRRAQTIGRAFGRRIWERSPRAADWMEWLGLAADLASEFVADAVDSIKPPPPPAAPELRLVQGEADAA